VTASERPQGSYLPKLVVHAKKYWQVLIVVALIAAVGAFFAKRPDTERDAVARSMEEHAEQWFKVEKTLADLAADLKTGNVKDAGACAAYALITLKSGAHYYINIRSQQQFASKLLTDALVAAPYHLVNVSDDLEPPVRPEARLLKQLRAVALPLLLQLPILIILLFMMGDVLRRPKLLAFEAKPDTRFDDVVGVEEAKEALEDIVAYLKQPARFTRLGARAPRGVILEGDPGTGKTMLARALAGESGAGFISMTGSDFTDKFVGVGVGRVKRLFKIARKHAPCVIFIDEMDGIGRRSSTATGGFAESENNRIINTLLKELDGFDGREGIIVVGATNHPDNLDPALRREGRFDRGCQLSLPSLDERMRLFKMYAPAHASIADADLRKLARIAIGLSPAAIATVVNAAALLAAKEGAAHVDHAHLLRSLEQHRMGVPLAALDAALSDAERHRIAVHEAGHAIVATLLKLGVVEKVSITPRRRALGVTLLTQELDQHLKTEPELQNQLEMLLAGRAAEALLLGDTSTGAVDDLKHASRLAYRMAGEFGFSPELGAFNYLALLPDGPSKPLEAAVVSEARQIVANAAERCAQRLGEQRDALEGLVSALLEYETVTGEVVQEKLKRTPHPARDASTFNATSAELATR
jgi:cell division protease FtsH